LPSSAKASSKSGAKSVSTSSTTTSSVISCTWKWQFHRYSTTISLLEKQHACEVLFFQQLGFLYENEVQAKLKSTIQHCLTCISIQFWYAAPALELFPDLLHDTPSAHRWEQKVKTSFKLFDTAPCNVNLQEELKSM
jgi:hypothetical protein